jgi:hypothetical protein
MKKTKTIARLQLKKATVLNLRITTIGRIRGGGFTLNQEEITRDFPTKDCITLACYTNNCFTDDCFTQWGCLTNNCVSEFCSNAPLNNPCISAFPVIC